MSLPITSRVKRAGKKECGCGCDCKCDKSPAKMWGVAKVAHGKKKK